MASIVTFLMKTYKFVFLDKFLGKSFSCNCRSSVRMSHIRLIELTETEVPGENYKSDSSTNFIKYYCINHTSNSDNKKKLVIGTDCINWLIDFDFNATFSNISAIMARGGSKGGAPGARHP